MIDDIKGSSVFGCHYSLFLERISADICIDGLTVIAGKNNTGKSTIGKTLFAVFNSFYNIQEKVRDKRNRNIYSVCSQAIRNYMAHNSIKLTSARSFQRVYLRVSSDIANAIMKSMDDGESLSIDSIVIVSLKKFGIVAEEESAIKDLEHDIENLVMSKLQVQDSKIIAEVVERYFKQVFNGQINSLDKLNRNCRIIAETV